MLNQPNPAQELERLQSKVNALENLLRSFQQSQIHQAQALAAFLSSNGEKGSTNINQPNYQQQYKIPRKPPPIATITYASSVSTTRPESNSVLNGGDCTLQTFDEDVQNWSEIYGIDMDELRLELKRQEEIFINTRIPDLERASDELRNADINFFRGAEQGKDHDGDDDFRLPEFLSLAGKGYQPVSVSIRDFTDMGCGNVVYYTASRFEDLWRALSRPRKLGMKTDMSVDEESAKWEKIRAYKGINLDGNEEHHAYGREIVINQLTPNVATAVLITAAFSGLKLESFEPAESLSWAISLALHREPRSVQNYEGYMNHNTFMFTAVFFELVDDDDANQRLSTIAAPSSHKGDKFGPKWEGIFAPRHSTRANKLRKEIRQTTLSLVFDSIGTENGTYWTITSVGKYSDERAFEKPRNFKAEDVAGYTAPEEVFLDKLARVIDWAVDDGMLEVMDQLELELEIPAKTLFNQQDNEKLLFDDHQFSRSKRYHWALQWLRKMSDSMNELVAAIEEFEKTSLLHLRRNAQAHRIRSDVKKGKIQSELSSEKVFERKVERAKQLKAKIEAKYTEIKDFRDALVSASGVLESRAAVSQAESMHILTIFMIIFLPVTIVISIFSMEVLPVTYKTLNTFAITMGVVFMVTLILGLNLGSILMLCTKYAQRFGRYLQASMIHVGGSWAGKGEALKDTDEAENLVRRGKKVPAELWYTWYCIMWVMFLLPANELYKAGGLRGLVSKVGCSKTNSGAKSNQSEGVWAMAAIPLRVLLLPLHVITVLFDYFLLMIFSKTLLGWDCDPQDKSLSDTDLCGGKEKALEEKSGLKGNPLSPWKDRFWAPIGILKEIPGRSRCQTPRPTERNTGSSNQSGILRNQQYTNSDMDLLLQKTAQKGKEMSSAITESPINSSTRIGDPASIAPKMQSPGMSPYIRTEQPSGTHPFKPRQYSPPALYPEEFDNQNPHYAPPVPPKPVISHIAPGVPFFYRSESLPALPPRGWGLSSLGAVSQSAYKIRGQQVDPERGRVGKSYIIEH